MITTWRRPKHTNERFAVAFDFARKLTGIDSVQLSVERVAGTDASPAALLDGSPQIDGTTVYQRLAAGADGANYLLTCVAVRGQDRHTVQAMLRVRDR